MNMKKYNYTVKAFVSGLFLCLLAGCVDLDISPKTVLVREDIFNDAGIKAYLVGMYNNLPMEDFKYDSNDGYFASLNNNSFACSTGEMVHANGMSFRRHRTGYWADGFKIIRQANALILDLPAYVGQLTGAESAIGEAKFIRAFVYFQLAKRYGGLPLIEEPQVLNSNDESTLWIARSSHEATYDFILADLDDAIAKMSESSSAGRANKYVAAAFKSRVALTAGTIARYGAMKFPEWEMDGILLQGIPPSRANGYFKQAWDAAKTVEAGPYELHRGNADKTVNYAEIWEKVDNSKESILVRKFDYLNWTHSYDALMSPLRMTITYGGRFAGPTLDWVELFDGIPLDPATGRFNGLDENGDYVVYDNCQQLWNGAEPRLRANLLLPGEVYKGLKLDVRSGLFNPGIDPAVAKFKKFSRDDGAVSEAYTSWPAAESENLFRNGTILRSQDDPRNQKDPVEYTTEAGEAVKVFKQGQDGPRFGSGGNISLTGFYGRKFLDLSKTLAQTNLHESYQTWVEIRYAEILLNRAEAAVELAQNGESTYNSVNLLQDAFECINNVRDRAGANLLTSPDELSTAPGYLKGTGIGSFVEGPTRGLQLVRIERYKELAFESKIYWDLHRWFTFDTQINQYRKRGLFPFMFCKGATVDASGTPDGKYIYDSRATENGSDRLTFSVNNYYETIPDAELKNNPLLQKNGNQ
jgi:hypothetical protein